MIGVGSSLQHNLLAMNSNRQLGINNSAFAKSTERLSSGYRINRAADDAAGLAISEKLRNQIRGLDRGAANLQDGISLCRVADGALSEVDDMLQRMNELAVKAANQTNTALDRHFIQQEVDSLVSEINRVGSTTAFNDILIFDEKIMAGEAGGSGEPESLIDAPSGEAGCMSESYPYNGKYNPCATIDFGKVNASNIANLNDGFFNFGCPQSCDERFDFVLKTDGTPSSATGIGSGDEHHKYVIDISKCKTGAEVAKTLYDYVSQHQPAGYGAAMDGIRVSHDTALMISGSRLIIAAIAEGQNTPEAAAAYEGLQNSGKVDMSGLTGIPMSVPLYGIPIQCSGTSGDKEYIYTKKMNGEVIGVDPLDVKTGAAAGESINKIKKAMEYVAALRSDFGASQNRLEHAYATNMNTSENTSAAESKIRDTDMAKETLTNSLQNILTQAGISMLAQANQVPQRVAELLTM